MKRKRDPRKLKTYRRCIAYMVDCMMSPVSVREVLLNEREVRLILEALGWLREDVETNRRLCEVTLDENERLRADLKEQIKLTAAAIAQEQKLEDALK